MNDDLDLVAAAYVDGELDAAARAQFEARLREDAALRQQVERERQLRALLGQAYAPVLDEPPPPRLEAVLSRQPKVVALDLARPQQGRRWDWTHWGGLAASLLLGLLIGRQLLPEGNEAVLAGLQAQGVLARALDRGRAGELQSGGVSLGLSFAAKGGGYCRSFTLAGSAGLACKQGVVEGWRLHQLMPATVPDKTEYRTAAAAGLPPALLTAVDELREGDVLDAAGEAAARAKGWRR